MGAFDSMFWNLFQTYGDKGFNTMNSMTLFYIAIVVFGLMITGLYLSVREFLATSQEPSQVKGPNPANE
jgi:hypothetical protein|tara:strand:+ start:538 stop:744 length:207 start_codon:yes stop_codon:yes gene_type:complete